MEVKIMEKYFPKTTIIDEGAEVPEGTIVKECTSCKQKFAVSPEFADTSICETCAEAVAKAAAVADMKANVAKI